MVTWKNVTLLIFFELVVFSAVIIYAQQQTIAKQRETIVTASAKNQTLAGDFKKYKKENQRQIVVSSNDARSKNVKIGSIIHSFANNIDGDISIFYKNLGTQESVIVDGARTYYMASLYKVIITLYVLDMEKRDEISFEDTIGDPPITIGEALEKVIAESNNEYAQAIAEKYGWKEIATYIKNQYTITFSFSEKLLANVENIGQLFVTITESQKLNRQDSENYLLSLLSKQQQLSKLPKYLPKSIYSHNKTGEFEQYSHDAGIFYTPKANYVLVFMSKTENPYNTNEQMALMSKEIYGVLNE